MDKNNSKNQFADDYTIEKGLMHQAIENAAMVCGGSAFSISVINEMLAKNKLDGEAINALLEHANGILGNARDQVKVYKSMLELIKASQKEEEAGLGKEKFGKKMKKNSNIPTA